ncbi:hypothetical protein BGW42_002634 [Actinomortierella wolfii]|nr:hypothetical protein BGW42_002634 [Actinomortierella wolfii]
MTTQHSSPSNGVEDLPYDEREEDYNEFEEYDEVTKPASRPFYKRKKYWIFCAIMTVITVAVAVPLALFVILPKVAQSIINHSTMEFNNIDITNPTTSTLSMTMDGTLGKTGPFSATIKFPEPIRVSYQDKLLGNMMLPETKASGGKGDLKASATFNIDDPDAFGAFSSDMMNKETFVWKLQSSVTIVALGQTVKNLKLDKEITLLGMNGFPDVQILRFDLPSDAPNGQGINLEIDTAMNNPSPIGITLGTVVLDISYQNVVLGQVKATGAALKGKSQSVLNLTGIMAPQTSPEALNVVSGLFSQYIAGNVSVTSAKGVSVLPDGTNEVPWLSSALKSMTLNVKLQSPTALNIIKSIELGPMGMNWTGVDAYAPITTSPSVKAGFEMPFGFSLNVTQVQNNMSVIYNEKNIASINVLNWGPATTIKEANASFIDFALPPTPFAINADSHGDFDSFVNKLTVGSGENFTVEGTAGTIAQTPIGEVTITGIPFKSGVFLSGLQGLKTQPTVINSLQVIGGVPEGLQIALDLTMFNPSELSIDTGVGDSAVVTFGMQYNGDNVGTVIFPSLALAPGENKKTAGALFTPTGTAGGQELLQKYMTNQVATVDVLGSSSSSAIAPLAAGLKDVQLQSDMPGQSAQLLLGTALTILDDTGKTGIASAVVTVNNPFIPELTITSIKSTVRYQGRALGSLDVPSTSIKVPGTSQANSPGLPLTMDLSIDSLISLMVSQAKINNLNAAPIEALAQMAKDPTVKIPSSVFAGFNLPTFVRAAMAGLKVDVEMSVEVMVGQYPTALTLTQNGVPTATDDTILKLLPIVGTPIAQAIVDLATLQFDNIMIYSPAETDFTTNINGLIGNTGPFDAEISFPEGSTVAWVNGDSESPIGQIAMPNVAAKADVGAKLALTNVPFKVASSQNMGDFVAYSLKAETFEWSVSANNMVIIAMGAPIPGINMKKKVTLKGFNGLQGLEIQKFDLPSNDPNGIHLTLQATLPNPSNVGIEMGTVEFAQIYQGQELGFVKTSGLKLLPDAITPIAMEGTMVKQTSEAGLKALGDLFRETLNGGSPKLTVKGKSVTPASGPVSWLSAAFGSLTMEVQLPSIGKVDLITGITLKTMTLDFTKGSAYAPMTSSDNIEANYKIPFAFPLNIAKVANDMNMQMPQGTTIANLKIPLSPAQTIAPNVLKMAYSDIPLKVSDGAHETFNHFSRILTTGPGVSFFLQGVADTVAETAAGNVEIPGIQVNVQSTMAGMNLNAGGAQVTNITVTGGTSEYLEIKQNVVLQNPSGLTVKVGKVSFDVGFHGVKLGEAIVDDMVLAPGTNTAPASFHLSPASAELRDNFLSGFVAGQSFTIDIAGSAQSTDIESLKEAFSSVKMSAAITGINDKLIALGSAAQPDILEMMQIFHERETPVQVMVYNPFDAPLYIKHMTASNSWRGMYFGAIDEDVGFTVPPKSTKLSPTVTMKSPAGAGFFSVLLPFMGAYPSLILGKMNEVPFDIQSTIVAYVGGPNGYMGNVKYAQANTIIQVQIGGEPPKGGIAALMPGANTTVATTVEATPTATSINEATPSPVAPTTTTPAEATTTEDAVPTTTDDAPASPTPKEDEANKPEPTPTTDANNNNVLAKRQAINLMELQPFPDENSSPEAIENYLKSVANKIAIEGGAAPPFA